MEAQTLPKKKTISKGKLKKSIKNILWRPDTLHWPELLEDDSQQLETALNTYKVDIPVFKKPHWNELKGIQKEKRPKAPAIPKVEGLIFGMSECSNAVQNGLCWAVIIEAKVEPRSIMQPTIEACVRANIPVVCLSGLKKICLKNFGIATSCLCIKKEFLPELRNEILSISNEHKPNKVLNKKEEIQAMDVVVIKECEHTDSPENINKFTYLYRSDKKTRIFLPSEAKILESKDFSGQNFISFTNNLKPKSNGNKFMRMTVKKILGNSNRIKRKKN